MYNRQLTLAFLALAILIYLGRTNVLKIITKAGAFKLGDAATPDVIELPDTLLPYIPTYKPGPDSWTQTTGLMCDCDGNSYKGPIFVNTIVVPPVPTPRYIYAG